MEWGWCMRSNAGSALMTAAIYFEMVQEKSLRTIKSRKKTAIWTLIILVVQLLCIFEHFHNKVLAVCQTLANVFSK